MSIAVCEHASWLIMCCFVASWARRSCQTSCVCRSPQLARVRLASSITRMMAPTRLVSVSGSDTNPISDDSVSELPWTGFFEVDPHVFRRLAPLSPGLYDIDCCPGYTWEYSDQHRGGLGHVVTPEKLEEMLPSWLQGSTTCIIGAFCTRCPVPCHHTLGGWFPLRSTVATWAQNDMDVAFYKAGDDRCFDLLCETDPDEPGLFDGDSVHKAINSCSEFLRNHYGAAHTQRMLSCEINNQPPAVPRLLAGEALVPCCMEMKRSAVTLWDF